ncbi:MAG: PEP-CTERM sorting domain-containing protein, partial [Chitinophagaceae bacterium]|nr:PEP-CTERM sorting domain-containing protein [Rubrivivax sp.]
GSALAGPLARSAGGTAYVARAVPLVPDIGAEDFFPIAPGGNTALSSNFADATQLFDQFSQAVRGISGQFFSTDEQGDLLAGSLNLLLVDQDGSFNYSLASGTTPSFLGFISDGAISSLSLSAVQPTGGFRYAAVDNLGLAVASAVPEPGAMSLSLLALGLMTLVVRRKRG